MMKLLLDQGLPQSTAALMREMGVDSLHVAEIGASTASDADILQIAQKQGRTVVTLDADFHALLALSGSTSPSVIRIRIEGLRAEALASVLSEVLHLCKEDMAHGAMITVQRKRIRTKRLPLVR